MDTNKRSRDKTEIKIGVYNFQNVSTVKYLKIVSKNERSLKVNQKQQKTANKSLLEASEVSKDKNLSECKTLQIWY